MTIKGTSGAGLEFGYFPVTPRASLFRSERVKFSADGSENGTMLTPEQCNDKIGKVLAAVCTVEGHAGARAGRVVVPGGSVVVEIAPVVEMLFCAVACEAFLARFLKLVQLIQVCIFAHYGRSASAR